MIHLTRQDRDIRKVLIDRVREASYDRPEQACLSYKQVNERLGHPHSGYSSLNLTHPLGHVSWYEFEHGRPMLSALVVNDETREAGGGFAKLARHLGREVSDEHEFWKAELLDVLDFWSDPDPTRAVDAALERIMSELGKIKANLRRMPPQT
jgi:hypothetical protein